MTKIRIGIIGSGGMARRHLARFAPMETAEVIAIASRNEGTGHQLAAEHETVFMPEWHRLLERDDIDGVVICTHNDSHGEIVLAALQADKHVFVEYPLASDVGEGEAALKLAEKRGLVLRVSHPEAVSNTHNALKQKIGELGDLLLTSFVRLTPGRGARLKFSSICLCQAPLRISLSTISIRLSISSAVLHQLKRVLSMKDSKKTDSTIGLSTHSLLNSNAVVLDSGHGQVGLRLTPPKNMNATFSPKVR